jgi:hypothetical protein
VEVDCGFGYREERVGKSAVEFVMHMREPPLRKNGNTQISPNLSHKLWKRLDPGMPGQSYQTKQASHQGARWTSIVSILKVPVLALIIETSAVWTWCRRSFQDICRGLDNYSWAYLWLISHHLSHGVPLMS